MWVQGGKRLVRVPVQRHPVIGQQISLRQHEGSAINATKQRAGRTHLAQPVANGFPVIQVGVKTRHDKNQAGLPDVQKRPI